MKGTQLTTRNAMGAFGLATGAIVVALVARYGYLTSLTPIDRLITALLFSIIAVAALAGPAVAVRFYRSPAGKAKLWGPIAGIVAIAALLANLNNSLGVIGGFAEQARAHAARTNDQDELQRVTTERAALDFAVTTEAVVATARDALLAADAARRTECDEGRGNRCQEFAADVAAKRDAFAALLKHRAATERAEKLDAEAAGIRARLDAAPTARAVGSRAALAQIFRLPDAGSVTWQLVAVAATVELLIAFSLVGWELLRKGPGTTEGVRRPLGKAPVGPTKREPAGSGHLAVFVHDCMRPAVGESVELRTLYSRFLEWCDEQHLSPLPPAKFSQAFITRCEKAQIDVRCEGANVLCLDVKLAPVELWDR